MACDEALEVFARLMPLLGLGVASDASAAVCLRFVPARATGVSAASGPAPSIWPDAELAQMPSSALLSARRNRSRGSELRFSVLGTSDLGGLTCRASALRTRAYVCV